MQSFLHLLDMEQNGESSLIVYIRDSIDILLNIEVQFKNSPITQLNDMARDVNCTRKFVNSLKFIRQNPSVVGNFIHCGRV